MNTNIIKKSFASQLPILAAMAYQNIIKAQIYKFFLIKDQN